MERIHILPYKRDFNEYIDWLVGCKLGSFIWHSKIKIVLLKFLMCHALGKICLHIIAVLKDRGVREAGMDRLTSKKGGHFLMHLTLFISIFKKS